MIKPFTSNFLRKFFLLALTALSGVAYAFAQAPVISSFTPASGPVGITVSINGTGFNINPINNIVFFGATMAKITAGSTTTINVTVPAGATYQPITVLNVSTGLTGYSAKPFITTFTPAKGAITKDDFTPPVPFSTVGACQAILIEDIDGDGKPDLVMSNTNLHTISVLRNISISGVITTGSFAPKVDFPVSDVNAAGPVQIAIGDLDGDGKPDIVVNNGGNSISVLRNTSSVGSINTNSFAPQFKLTTSSQGAGCIAVLDLDGDGKSEIVAARSTDAGLSIWQNIASSGSLNTASFGTRVDIAGHNSSGGGFGLAVSDLDGDGKPDLAVTDFVANTVSVFRNTSSIGSLSTNSFAPFFDYAVGKQPFGIKISDLDGDGKPEIITANNLDNSISVLRNSSASGSITGNSFSGHVDFATGSNPRDLVISDLDGDDKPDVAVANTSGNFISILRNTTITGTIASDSFNSQVTFTTGNNPTAIAVGDLDGDGKADLVVPTLGSSAATGNSVSAFRNNPLFPPTVAANNFTFSNTTINSTTANWINGNGSARAVFISVPSISVLPLNSTTYNANPVYGSGSQIGSFGWYCVYNGTGNSVTITGLSSGVTYNVIVIEYTGTPGSENYLTYILSGGTVTTLPGGSVALNSINIATYSLTNLTTVKYLVTFAAPVTGLNTGNFALATTGTIAGASVTSIVYAGEAADTVTVNTGTGNGTIGLNLVNASGITGGILTPLPFIGEIYTVDRTIAIPKPPVIFSFTPSKGPDGTTTTITGTGFGSTAANNTVYFGATMAPVTAASTTSLTVKAPVGATYEPLSVLNSSTALTGYSTKPFLPTFAPSKGAINECDFMPPVAYNIGGGATDDIIIADIDGDGKPDLIIPNGYLNVISVYRNTSSSGAITAASFAAKVDFVASGYVISVVDLDGDGKLDLVAIGVEANQTSTMYIFRNTSTRGSITTGSFASVVKLTLPNATYGYIGTGDFDGDGKPDLVIGSGGGSSLLIYRNKAVRGSITAGSFEAQSKILAANQPYAYGYSLAVADMDGDGKPDIITNTGMINNSPDSIAVYRNISVTGPLNNLLFAPPVRFGVGQSPYSITVADLDGDGKPEIITPNLKSNTFSVLHNTSVAGSITANSFAPKVDFATGISPCNIRVGDLDGDGKPDLAVVKGVFFSALNTASDSISVYRNTTTPGSITSGSFAPKIELASGNNSSVGGGLFVLAVGDLDGDGKPDIAAVGSRTHYGPNGSYNPVYILRNNPIFPPNIQATNIVFSATGTNTTTASWTIGNGTARAVFIKVASTGSPLPTGSTTYTANATFGLGSQIGTSGWYCIYNGTGNTVGITGLSSGATYRVMVVEYTGTPGCENYLTTPSTGNPANITSLTGGAVAIDTISLITASLTNAATVQYTATFAAAIKGLTTSNFALVTTGGVSGAAISSVSGSGASYTITVNAGTGDGTIGLNLGNTTGLTPGIITPLPFTGAVYTIDRTPPTIAIGNPSVSSILSGTDTLVTYAVTYADANFKASTLSATNITLNSTGTAQGIISISGSGTADTVTVSGITGSGSLGISIAGGTASDLAGNTAPAAGPSATFLVDPVLSNLTISSGTLSPVFTSTGLSYNTPVTNATATILVTPTAADPTATVTVNGNKPSTPVDLVVGFNQITITVTSPDGKATTSYTIGVTRAAPVITGQPPKIAYGNGSIVLTNAEPFSTVPTNTGGAVPATNYGQVSIFAGSPTETGGYINATGTAAQFNQPQQMVSDAAGNLYVADAGNNAIRKISPAGVVTTFAGSLTGASGFTNGNGTAALFAYPDGVAIDGSGNLFVSDYSNNAIRKITPGGMVSTLYTSSDPFGPGGSCVDATGNLIVAAQDASQIIKVTPAGVATVVAGGTPGYVNGMVAAAQFSDPTDVKVDSQGNLYVVDFENNAIRKITPAGVVSTIAGSNVSGNTPGYANGAGTAAVFNNPTGLALTPGGVIYVADIYNNDIRRIAPDGTVSLLAGSAAQVPSDADGVGTAAGFNQPVYIYIDASGTGYVTEFGGNRIRKLTLTGYTLNGTLPQGLAFDPTTGNISGTPVIPFTAKTDTITAYNAYGFSTAVFTISYHTASNVATLINLVPGNGTLTPVFASNTTGYTDAVPNLTANITLTPTATDTTAAITVNGTAVKSGTASGSINLAVGPNIITTVVTAQDGTTKDSYTVTINRAALSSVATLNNLTISQGILTPAFASETMNYSAAVATAANTVTVTPATNDANATITMNGTAVTSGTASQPITLAVGPNTITTVVTAQDGITTDTYTIIVTRAPSTDATLKDLTLSSGPLTPGFASGMLNYTAGVANAVTTVTVTPVTNDVNATIKVNGTPVTSGTASQSITLAVGPNLITTIVTAQDGTTTDTYTIIVTRAPDANAMLVNLSISQGTLTPAFNSATKSYTDNVPNSTGSVTVTPTASDNTATLMVNGETVPSGTASAPIALSIGPNTITTVVTAADGSTKVTYVVIVNRAVSADATLINLTASQGTLSPGFSSGTTAYADTVFNSISSITVTPTTNNNTATVTVNGTAVKSGNPSDAISLDIGTNTITVTVTAQDGVTIGTYTVTVYRGEAITALDANNVLTPNGDGKNDVWVIKDIRLYPQNNVTIYDKAGRVVYTKRGYTNDWDGTLNGQPLAEGTYYYIVDLGPNQRKVKGYIGILRN